MKLEVIVNNGIEAIQAEALGADRLELVSAINEGGLTPSYGTIKQVLNSVSIPVQVMIRPHSYHFCYSNNDMEIICADIEQLLDLGGNRIVFGALTEDNKVDTTILEKVITIDSSLDITFHRAFDETASLTDAYRTLNNYKNVKRVLTSGGAANCDNGKEMLKKLVEMEADLNGPKIMPGSGLTPYNIKEIHDAVQADNYHFGKAVRIDNDFKYGFDKASMEQIKQIVKG
ncbi:MAG: copper homeostasis protein CutC [Bacillota bacterium]|uniref:PF03932 family protein CutC n=2 Tax=Virgibacillus salarius TaxID=447199 RepID=A0A941DTE6_9BACI|nr:MULTISPECIES: copper homeostasis protein CutC [Bacillaceae]MBR7795057.1 copper homeostasis protein CutC [Virgibacillus salarius]MDY7043127.1 copper homeostasis protein CutC [Virgibacillus sp. M23]NAZ07775.1 copper homeostasis protein CutC [Agaribacter marinus]